MKNISHKLLYVVPVAFSGAAFAAPPSEKSSGGLPQMDPTWFASQIFWLIVIFSFLYAVFSKSVLPALSSTIEGRREQIENDLETARKLKDEAEKIHNEYDQAITKAKDTANTLYLEVEEQSKKEAEQRLAKLTSESAETIQKAANDISSTKDKALQEIDDLTVEMVVLATEKLTGIKTEAKAAKAIIDGLNPDQITKKAA